MSFFRGVLIVTTLMGSVATDAAGQWNAVSPFAGGAIIMGAQGFGRTSITSGGLMLGARIGYLTRSMSDDESIAFAAVGFGFGGRRREGEQPRNVVARTSIP